MSDTGRQSLSDKAASAVKPDSQKSTGEQISNKAKGMADSVASTLQPEGEKSYTQEASDKMSTSSSNTNHESLVDKAKNAMGLGQQGKDQ